MDREQIRMLAAKGAVLWKSHATKRAVKRGIKRSEVDDVLINGEIIEDYPYNEPDPCCLMLGTLEKPLHVVCGIADEILIVITVYHPDAPVWNDDFKTRREK